MIAGVLLFAAGATTTVLGCAAMQATAQPMQGGWMLPALEGPLCGQGVFGALPAFAAMWLAMMVAMMLPSLAPSLWRYRSLLDRARVPHADRQVVLAGAGYFATWMLVGLALYVSGDALGAVLPQHPAWSRAMPAIGGAAIVLAGIAQFSAWKRRQLACCRAAFLCVDRGACAAWCRGMRLGLHCNAACANLTAALLALGMMDLCAMVFVSAAITAERLAPRAMHVVPGIGVALVGVGACVIGHVLA